MFTSSTSKSFLSARAVALAASTLILTLPVTVLAGSDSDSDSDRRWVAEGPAPMAFAQIENVVPNDEVSGAIEDVAPHPTKANILYVATVNGGIWRTKNALDAQPTWKNLTRNQESNSFGALEFDPTDPKHKTLVAGFGLTSSFSRQGTARAGLIRSTNRGNKWTPIDGGGILRGKNIDGIAARGDILVVSVDIADSFTFDNIGMFRSEDGGATFTQISGAAGSGLPLGATYDLVADPNNPARLYTATVFSNFVGGVNGFYRSEDNGATWTRISDATIEAQLAPVVSSASKVEFAVGNQNNVFAIITVSGVTTGVFRSGDGGDTWQQLDLPTTIEGGGVAFGLHPGGQGSLHLSIAADPVDPNVVYVGGDRQPFFSEGAPGSGGFFPNSIGAGTFSARLFRGDASQPSGSQWVHLTHSNVLGAPGGGTASSSSPHADSRDMAFDAAGNLIETDDGGVYKRTSPRDNTGDWFSLNGNLQVTEIHDHENDINSDILFSGNQDNGTSVQSTPGDLVWTLLLSGDGGDAAVDNVTLAAQNQSIRYSSAQFLGNFVVTFWDQANNLINFFFPPLTVLNGGNPIATQFTTPFEANAIDGTRLLIGGANSLYESLDQGNTVTEIGPGVFAVGTGRNPFAYGHPDDPDVIYSGNLDSIVVRRGGIAQPLQARPSFPGTGSGFTIRGIAIDPDDVDTAYVANATGVFITNDAGVTWTDVTGDLTDSALPFLRGIAFIPRVNDDDGSDSDSDGGVSTNDLLVVAASNGVFFAKENQGYLQWKPLGKRLPVVPVFDLDYDATTDNLTAGTLGRGAYSLDGLGGGADSDSDSDSD